MKQTIIFICEHGAAKSVIAAAYFNKIAQEKNLDLQAIARGTHPDAELAQPAINGLLQDGVIFDKQKPTLILEAEVANSKAIVSFCDLPKNYSDLTSIENWGDVPPVSVDYEKARNAILDYLNQYMEKL